MQKQQNVIDIATHHEDFRQDGMRFSVSSRKITHAMGVAEYLKFFYIYTDMDKVESLFGSTTTPAPLYGGRAYKPGHSITDSQRDEMRDLGIGLALTLTTHLFDDDAYKKTLPLLRENHRTGNSVICTNDELARRVRQDFPDYNLKASIIKHITTLEGIEEALALYDYVVIPMDLNDDDQFLMSIQRKDRIMLFGNASCAYTCPARTCYRSFSKKNFGLEAENTCSKKLGIERLEVGEVYFNVAKFKQMGFSLFKMVPPTSKAPIAAIEKFSARKRSMSDAQ
jgi:hypothetical protein